MLRFNATGHHEFVSNVYCALVSQVLVTPTLFRDRLQLYILRAITTSRTTSTPRGSLGLAADHITNR